MSLLDSTEYTGERGAYAGVNLPEAFSARILELCDTLGLEHPEVDDLHCTVMYSREHTLNSLPVINSAINALVTSVQHWVGHNGKTYVVADIQSMALVQLHTKFSKLGARHSFSAYRPHITLGKIAEPQEDLDQKIDELNWLLKLNPVHVAFLGCVVKDINED